MIVLLGFLICAALLAMFAVLAPPVGGGLLTAMLLGACIGLVGWFIINAAESLQNSWDDWWEDFWASRRPSLPPPPLPPSPPPAPSWRADILLMLGITCWWAALIAGGYLLAVSQTTASGS
jgi:hypothetical protein